MSVLRHLDPEQLISNGYDAKLDSQPVLAIVGLQAAFSLGADYQQEVDLISLLKMSHINMFIWQAHRLKFVTWLTVPFE